MTEMVVFEGATESMSLATLARVAGKTGDLWARTENIAEEIRRLEIARIKKLEDSDEDVAIIYRTRREERIAKAYPKIKFEVCDCHYEVTEAVADLIKRLMYIGHWAWETHCSTDSDVVCDETLWLSGLCNAHIGDLLKEYGCDHECRDIHSVAISGTTIVCQVLVSPPEKVAA